MITKKFEEVAAAFPSNIAIKTGNKTITYNRLNTCANDIARAIAERLKIVENQARDHEKNGDQTGKQRVALLFEHGIEMIIAVLAALKAKTVYVPLDVTYPTKRLSYMLEDSDSALILTNNESLPLAGELAAEN
ncbi:MAG: amino acid adenylation domain-containing protein, partial [bacterium]|nr:amino acid adenylation domain-containing protein [bacterium]